MVQVRARVDFENYSMFSVSSKLLKIHSSQKCNPMRENLLKLTLFSFFMPLKVMKESERRRMSCCCSKDGDKSRKSEIESRLNPPISWLLICWLQPFHVMLQSLSIFLERKSEMRVWTKKLLLGWVGEERAIRGLRARAPSCKSHTSDTFETLSTTPTLDSLCQGNAIHVVDTEACPLDNFAMR